ncbi:MAG TPA: hypothetical protein VI792_08245 [Candidatus Eisenbacteria bacterium]
MSEEKNTRRRPLEELIPDEAFDHAKAAFEELKKGVEGLFPPGLADHRRAARKEILLAMRTVIDAALNRVEKTPKS